MSTYKYSELIKKTKEGLNKVQESRDLIQEAIDICIRTDNQEHGIYETNMEFLGEADMLLSKAAKTLKEIAEGKTI